MTQARGQSHTEHKVAYISHALQLEAESLGQRRLEVKNFLVDQCASEQKAVRHTYGDPEVVKSTLDRLKSKELRLFDEPVRNITFLPNAFTQPAIMHVLWNPIKEAFEALPEWQIYFPGLKAICKSLSDSSYKELHMAKTFQDFPSSYLWIGLGFGFSCMTCSSQFRKSQMFCQHCKYI